ASNPAATPTNPAADRSSAGAARRRISAATCCCSAGDSASNAVTTSRAVAVMIRTPEPTRNDIGNDRCSQSPFGLRAEYRLGPRDGAPQRQLQLTAPQPRP